MYPFVLVLPKRALSPASHDIHSSSITSPLATAMAQLHCGTSMLITKSPLLLSPTQLLRDTRQNAPFMHLQKHSSHGSLFFSLLYFLLLNLTRWVLLTFFSVGSSSPLSSTWQLVHLCWRWSSLPLGLRSQHILMGELFFLVWLSYTVDRPESHPGWKTGNYVWRSCLQGSGPEPTSSHCRQAGDQFLACQSRNQCTCLCKWHTLSPLPISCVRRLKKNHNHRQRQVLFKEGCFELI